jgi:Schlafen group 3, DNA/RNA helicase domain
VGPDRRPAVGRPSKGVAPAAVIAGRAWNPALRIRQWAKRWLRQQARGNERYGIVVSSQAQRLKPHAIDVRSKVNPIHWFLDGKADVRSSDSLEDVATEFHVQGLELDWTCVTWDADFRHKESGWSHWSFIGSFRGPNESTGSMPYSSFSTRSASRIIRSSDVGSPFLT